MAVETKRDVHQVLTEYLEERYAATRAERLRAELLELIGEDHTHDPNRCQWCLSRNQRAMGMQR